MWRGPLHVTLKIIKIKSQWRYMWNGFVKFGEVNKGQDIYALHKISVQDDDFNFSSSRIFIFLMYHFNAKKKWLWLKLHCVMMTLPTYIQLVILHLNISLGQTRVDVFVLSLFSITFLYIYWLEFGTNNAIRILNHNNIILHIIVLHAIPKLEDSQLFLWLVTMWPIPKFWDS